MQMKIQLIDNHDEQFANGEKTESEEGWTTVVGKTKSNKFSDILKTTVASAFHEEKTKCDIIISKAVDDDKDKAFLADLCGKMEFTTIPQNPQRLGKKGGHPRLLKASFPSAFDARSFIARYDELRRTNSDKIPTLRIRPNKPKEEREKFSKQSKLAYDLNCRAKENNTQESYSLRDDGSIWKYALSTDNKWKRVSDWRPSSSGNE